MQVIVEVLFQEIYHEVTHRHPVGRHLLGAEFGFGLRLKDRLFDLDADGCNDGGPNVRGIKILFVELPHGLYYRLAKSGLMRPALSGVLPIDKRIVAFVISVSVSHRHLDIFALEVNRRVEEVAPDTFGQQVEQPVFRDIRHPVEPYHQSGIEVGVVSNHRFDVLEIVAVIAKYHGIGHKLHPCTVLFARGIGMFPDFLPCSKLNGARLTIPGTGNDKTR